MCVVRKMKSVWLVCVVAMAVLLGFASAATSGLRESIENDISSNSVIVFSKSYCPYVLALCAAAVSRVCAALWGWWAFLFARRCAGWRLFFLLFARGCCAGCSMV